MITLQKFCAQLFYWDELYKVILITDTYILLTF